MIHNVATMVAKSLLRTRLSRRRIFFIQSVFALAVALSIAFAALYVVQPKNPVITFLLKNIFTSPNGQVLLAIIVGMSTLITTVTATNLAENSQSIESIAKEIAITNKSKTEIDSKLEEKKRIFQSTPIFSFYFSDDITIAETYKDYFYGLIADSASAENTDEIGMEAKMNFQALGASLSGKDAHKTISNFKMTDLTTSHMFRRIIEETLKKDQVKLGLEELDIDLTELKEFDAIIAKLISKFGFAVEKSILEDIRSKLKEKAARNTLIRLENASDWQLLDGKFKIEDDGNYYKCTCVHPVNQYIGKREISITISVRISKNSKGKVSDIFESFVGSDGIPLKVYGKVIMPIDRNSDKWDLLIAPLAIY